MVHVGFRSGETQPTLLQDDTLRNIRGMSRVEYNEIHFSIRSGKIMQYRRSRAKGATFFFTVITNERKKILCQKTNVALIKEAFYQVVQRHTFRIRAFVLLPEHIHCIWTLPEDDNDFPMRWRLIKSYFSRRCNAGYKRHQSVSRLNKGEQGVWQRRF